MTIHIYAYDDQHTGRWGEQVVMAALKVGIPASLFTDIKQIGFKGNPSYIFAHIHNNEKWRDKEKRMLAALEQLRLNGANCVLIPDARWVNWYDDKETQALDFEDWMPKTWLANHYIAWMTDFKFQSHRYPVICKTPKGSGSKGVALANNIDEITALVKNGHVVIQEFQRGNKYDYRVCSCGDYIYVLRRWNRPDKPFASGSGKWEAITTKNWEDEMDAMVQVAMEFFAYNKLPWCGIDLVFNPDAGIWQILEATVGWKMQAYYECQLFRNAITYNQVRPIERGCKLYGYHIWDVLCQEIAIGVFDR